MSGLFFILSLQLRKAGFDPAKFKIHKRKKENIMACVNAKKNQRTVMTAQILETEIETSKTFKAKEADRLLFGVDSQTPSNDRLQNNITEFEWAVRNKIYPNFWGRNITGQNALTKEEIQFLHSMGCKIAAIYNDTEPKENDAQGKMAAKKSAVIALELGIPAGTAIFLETGENENISTDYMRAFAQTLLFEGFTPGFKANTDAMFSFDREYSRGHQTDKELFEKCLVWATAPTLEEYDRITTTHLIRPDNWIPYAPSGITRRDIAVWQYGTECHPIQDDAGNPTFFNVNLVRDETVVIHKMF